MGFVDFQGETWAGVFFVVSVLLIAGTVISSIAFRAIGYLQAQATARAAAVGDHDYRELAHQSVHRQDELVDRLDRIEERLTAMERMLREVDEPAPVR